MLAFRYADASVLAPYRGRRPAARGFKANARSGRLEGGTRFVTSWMGGTPYAAGQFTTYLPACAKQALVGTNAFALNRSERCLG